MKTKTIKIEILVTVPTSIKTADIDVSEVDDGEYLAVTFAPEPSMLPRNFTKSFRFSFKVTQPNQYLILFGGEAVSILENKGINALISEIRDNALGYGISNLELNTPAEMLSAASGWDNFAILTPEQYIKLAAL